MQEMCMAKSAAEERKTLVDISNGISNEVREALGLASDINVILFNEVQGGEKDMPAVNCMYDEMKMNEIGLQSLIAMLAEMRERLAR